MPARGVPNTIIPAVVSDIGLRQISGGGDIKFLPTYVANFILEWQKIITQFKTRSKKFLFNSNKKMEVKIFFSGNRFLSNGAIIDVSD